MAKTTKIRIQEKKASPVDLSTYIDKYLWIIIPILTIVYYYFSKISPGFYQDDEIGHFLNMREFWTNPFSILGNWPKPGYKIFMIVPALFGYQGAIFVNAFYAALTVYLTYILIKKYELKFAFLGAILLSIQPLFFDLSFRSYGEIFMALLFVIMLIFYKEEKLFLTGLTCGFIFLVRQEIVILAAIIGVIFIFRKNYYAILSLFIFPIIYGILGYVKSGDPLFIYSEMTNLASLDFGGANRGFIHYFKVYIFIVGPITLSLFLLGYLGFIDKTKNIKEYLKKFNLPYLVFTITFLVQVMIMIRGTNPGTWRYLLPISPIVSFFTVVGFNNLTKSDFRKVNIAITGILAVLTGLFLSKTTNGLDLTDNSEVIKFIIIVLFLAVSSFISVKNVIRYQNSLSVIVIFLSLIYLVYSFSPRVLSPENITVKKIADYLNTEEIRNKKIYYTNVLIIFFGEIDLQRRKDFIHLDLANLNNAEKGSIIIWDSHYGFRPEFKSDVEIKVLQDSTKYKPINQFISTDRKFAGYVFEKIN